MACGHIPRHSGASRNPGRKEPLPPAPVKFPISQSNLPESTHHPKSGHTSALPLAPTPERRVAPHASHHQGDPAPSNFAPLPGILNVRRCWKPVRMPTARPIRPAIQNPQNSLQNDDASMLDFAELIPHTIPNQVKEIRFCHNPTGRQRPFVGTKSQRPTQTAASLI